MIGFKKTAIVALLAGLGFTGASQASLIDRGNGLLYDNVLNVTWLQDANYAKTSGYGATGLMSWDNATTWAANLNFDGLTGWRLPTRDGYELYSIFNELLSGIPGARMTTHLFPFINVQLGAYWYGNTFVSDVTDTQHYADVWYAYMFEGNGYLSESVMSKDNHLSAWAVHPGDVAAVPVLGAAWLFGSGLIGLLSFKRSKNKQPT